MLNIMDTFFPQCMLRKDDRGNHEWWCNWTLSMSFEFQEMIIVFEIFCMKEKKRFDIKTSGFFQLSLMDITNSHWVI